jgi:2-iminobutanoate/2-iminopropanoate deaminase
MARHLAGAITVHAMNKPLGPYTPAVRAGDFVFVSGQLGMRDGSLVDGGVVGETAQAVANLGDRLTEMGASLTDVVKTTCFLIDMDMFATFNTAYVEAFGDHRPARSTIAVRELPAKGQVEIEAVAYSPRG